MFARICHFLSQFFTRSSTINNEPINKVSLIVLVIIDIFILINVFSGLDNISRWHVSPPEAYPCYADWQRYQTSTAKDKDYAMIRLALPFYRDSQLNFQQSDRQVETGHLGTVSQTCLDYAADQDKINTSQNQQTIKTIDQKQTRIGTLKQTNQTIRSQYDSTLLEKIAGQGREQSINVVGAEKAKQTLDQNNSAISTLEQDISTLKKGLLTQPEIVSFIAFLKDPGKFKTVETGYQQASFWYPSLRLVLQAGFLLPLIAIAALLHRVAQRRDYGLIALISWHLLVIFFIPLLLKVFEFLQVGAIFQVIVDLIYSLLGGLLFLVSYLYIVLIPLIGFGIIKFFQRIVFNPRLQAAGRFQKSRCVKCAKRIRHQDDFCPHCGYYQYVECENCHTLTYKHLPHCKQCGTGQNLGHL